MKKVRHKRKSLNYYKILATVVACVIVLTCMVVGAYAVRYYNQKSSVGSFESRLSSISPISSPISIKKDYFDPVFLQKFRDTAVAQGIEPERIEQFIKMKQGQQNSTPSPFIIREYEPQDLMNDKQRESRTSCQKEINEYTVCMADYSVQMNEYLNCLIEDHIYKKICAKPDEFCVRPACIY